MSQAPTRRAWREPVGLLAVSLVGSAAIWGRLWVTAPTTRGVCGCGDPALFQWFLAWPAHAITTGHSLVFSRDLFHPTGVNLLANTSVLALGLVLAPVTWLGGPVLTQNLALLLAVPAAVCAMDLLLRRVTDAWPVRVTLALLYGFSPYMVANLAVSHLMLAWIAMLPLIALGAVDALAEDRGRRIRGQVLLAGALVVQFFLSTELLLLAAVTVLLLGCILGITAVVTRIAAALGHRGSTAPAAGEVEVRGAGPGAALATQAAGVGVRSGARRLAVPLGVAVVLLAVPAAYALFGPASLKGKIWGPAFNPYTGGTSWQDLVRPHAVSGGFSFLSGYTGPPVVQLQFLGWGLVVATAATAVWRWRDSVVRAGALTALGCLILSLSTSVGSWVPWRWIGRLPVLQNVLQFRIVVFALLAAVIVIARGAGELVQRGRTGTGIAAVALAAVVVPVWIPVAQSLPLRTVPVASPAWWRSATGPGVVLAYPYPSALLQAPLTWQARGAFAVAQLGGGGPQGSVAGATGAAALLNDLSMHVGADRPGATPSSAALVRATMVRDGVTEVVVPIDLRGRFLVTGAPSPWAAAFFTQVLGLAPAVTDGAWVFAVRAPLPAPHLVSRASARRCTALAARRGAGALGPCVLSGTPR